MTAYEAMVAEANAQRWPESFKQDLTKWDRNRIVCSGAHHNKEERDENCPKKKED